MIADPFVVIGGDVAADQALEGQMTVDEMENLDLADAPPFSRVWDPVLVAAKVLNGSLEETSEN